MIFNIRFRIYYGWNNFFCICNDKKQKRKKMNTICMSFLTYFEYLCAYPPPLPPPRKALDISIQISVHSLKMF